MARQLAKHKFEELEKLYQQNVDNQTVLQNLLEELGFRTKNKKIPELRKNVENALRCIESGAADTAVLGHSPEAGAEQTSAKTTEPSVAVPISWDVEQRAVIELDHSDTKIVEAGPGAGKTAVACARVAYLIEQECLEASKIFLISFTRTAVREIRDRIESFAEDRLNVAGLQILTLDSFTWQVLRGLTTQEPTELLRSYETNIKQLVEQLKDGDTALLDYLEEFEHVVLDEGQDLVGARADLAVQLIRRLDKNCGVTVFADSAQAIYGFTDDSEQHGAHSALTLVERINSGELVGFERIKLQNVHRTNDPKLKELYTAGRERLLDRKESDPDGWKSMKELIQSCAHGSVQSVTKQDLRDKSDHLVLFRTRAEVLLESSFLWNEGVEHKLRMSGTQQRCHPWIAQLLGAYEEDLLTYEDFCSLWSERIGVLAPGEDPDSVWQLLLENVGDRHDRVRFVRLREILGRERPPIDFLVDEEKFAGPVLSTIHASKGREANQVHLMLPPDGFIASTDNSEHEMSAREIAEEERVLFVGATRARKQLLTGKGKITYSSRLPSGRTYRRVRRGGRRRMVEIGLMSDLDRTSVVDTRLVDDPASLQAWLWENAYRVVNAEIQYDHSLRGNVLYETQAMKPIAMLSDKFNKDLWKLAQIVSGNEETPPLRPPGKIKHLRILGAGTIVVPEALRADLPQPWRHSGVLLMPIISGFPTLCFNPMKQSS